MYPWKPRQKATFALEVYDCLVFSDLNSSAHLKNNYASRVDVEVAPPLFQPQQQQQQQQQQRVSRGFSSGSGGGGLPGGAVTPAGPPRGDYHTDSAESLREIPVSSTRAGGNPVPRGIPSRQSASDVIYTYDVQNGGLLRSHVHSSEKPKRKKRSTTPHGKAKRSHTPRRSNSNPIQYYNNPEFDPNDNVNTNATFSTTLENTDISMGTRTLPDTDLANGFPSGSTQKRADVPPLDLGELAVDSDSDDVVTKPATHNHKKLKRIVTKI